MANLIYQNSKSGKNKSGLIFAFWALLTHIKWQKIEIKALTFGLNEHLGVELKTHAV